MSYQLNKSHLLICIFAGFVLTGGFVWQILFSFSLPLFAMALWVSSGIVIFYFVGWIARSILINDVFKRDESDYNFEQDEEYQAFLASLNAPVPGDVMTDEPAENPESYDDTFDDPYMEPVPFKDAS